MASDDDNEIRMLIKNYTPHIGIIFLLKVKTSVFFHNNQTYIG